MSSFGAQREELCRVDRSLFERGYMHATAGNITLRLPDAQGFPITPTDACLGFLQPDQLARRRGSCTDRRPTCQQDARAAPSDLHH